jgi:hypothetical protein
MPRSFWNKISNRFFASWAAALKICSADDATCQDAASISTVIETRAVANNSCFSLTTSLPVPAFSDPQNQSQFARAGSFQAVMVSNPRLHSLAE